MEFIIAPKDFPNDETLTIIECLFENKQLVNEDDECLSVEGSKAIFSVVAPQSGIIHWLVNVGDIVPVGDVIAVIYQEDEQQALRLYLDKQKQEIETPSQPPAHFTLPAFKLANKLLVDLKLFDDFELVTTRDVYKIKDMKLLDELEKHKQILLPCNGNGNTLLVGAGKAASQILAVLGRDEQTKVIGFLDDTPEKQGTKHLGYPILGAVDEIEKVLKHHDIDSILCCAGNMQLRVKVLELALHHNLQLGNAIHQTAVFDGDVVIGGGNYIGPQCFFGSQAEIGFGCFISSGAIFEHHNIVGHCVTTGPANACSGSVTIGDFCVFGSGIIIEPLVTIGDYSAIASGCVITKDIPANSTLKKSMNYTLR